MSKAIKLKIDNQGNAETTFTIPTNADWEGAHKEGKEGVPRYFYLKEKESGIEFPRAYYVANPNKTEEENKKNSNRIIALMLKVSNTLTLDEFMETKSAVILSEEHPELKQDNSNAYEPLIWGKKFTCTEREKLLQICNDRFAIANTCRWMVI